MSSAFSIPADAVRVWRGYRAPKKNGQTEADALAAFFKSLGEVFVPATVKMQIAIGLDGYLPAIPAGLPGKPDTVPDETAILFWDSQQTYTDCFKTLAARTYTLTHNAVYRPPSGANFPQFFSGALTAEQPVHLFKKPADWMKGQVHHLLGSRPAATSPADFRAGIAASLSAIQQAGEIEGAIACAGDDYLTFWSLGNSQEISDLQKQLDWSKLLTNAPTTIEAGLYNIWSGMTIGSGDCFNMQFQRRWET